MILSPPQRKTGAPPRRRARLSGFVSMVVLVGVVAVVGVGAGSGVASASAAKGSSNPAKGSPAWCKKHPGSKLPACKGGSGSGGGSGGPNPTMTVSASPSPLVETGQSEVYAVVQVETSASLAGDTVLITTSQLAATCGGAVLFGSLQAGAVYGPDSVQVVLDDDGNATVSLYGINCAPGPSTVEADLTVAPFTSALGVVDAAAPVPTTAGVTGFPNPEVETGNSPASGESDVFAVFYVETDPVYAEQSVQIDADQLFYRCLGGITWISNQGSFAGPTATATLDNDGNAVFAFSGSSCAAGSSDVLADVLAGTNPTYTSTYTIDAPAPTI